MKRMIAELLTSKKGAMMIASITAYVIARIGFDVEADQILPVLGMIAAWLVGQGLADHGKSAAKINAVSALAGQDSLSFLAHKDGDEARRTALDKATQIAKSVAPVLVFGLAIQGAGCATVKRSAAVGVSTYLDCTTPGLRDIASDGWDVTRAALPNWIDGSGQVDTAQLKAQWQTVKSDAGKCFISGGIAALLSLVDGPKGDAPQSAAVVVDSGALRKAFSSASGGMTVRVRETVL